MAALVDLPEWRALEADASTVGAQHLRDLFDADPARGDHMHAEVAGWYFDYAKHRVTDETIAHLAALADARDLRGRVDAMFRGEHINRTEDRPVLHVALRMPRQVQTIIKGDQTVLSVAAASVVAKVTRDAMMAEEAEHYPAYGFESNRGYPARVHKCALAAYGPSAIHRRSWIFMDYCLWGGIAKYEREPRLF